MEEYGILTIVCIDICMYTSWVVYSKRGALIESQKKDGIFQRGAAKAATTEEEKRKGRRCKENLPRCMWNINKYLYAHVPFIVYVTIIIGRTAVSPLSCTNHKHI